MAGFEIRLECEDCGEDLDVTYHNATLIASIKPCEQCVREGIAAEILKIRERLEEAVNEAITKGKKDADARVC